MEKIIIIGVALLILLLVLQFLVSLWKSIADKRYLELAVFDLIAVVIVAGLFIAKL